MEKKFTASYRKQNINQEDYNRTSLRKRQTLGQQQKAQMTADFRSRKMEEKVDFLYLIDIYCKVTRLGNMVGKQQRAGLA